MENKFIDTLKERIDNVKTTAMIMPFNDYNEGVKMGISMIENIIDDMIDEKICPLCYDCPDNCPIDMIEK